MKFWEALQQHREKQKRGPIFYIFYGIGLLIGGSIIIAIVAATYILFGYIFSSLWNYAVSPVFSVSELTSLTAAALLLLVWGVFRLIKVALKS